MGTRKWTHKVVKIARGMQGEWFDFPTAATFDSQAAAEKYAKEFADEQRGVVGARITVRTRGGKTISTYSTLLDAAEWHADV